MNFFLLYFVFFSTTKHLDWSVAFRASWRSPTGSCRKGGGIRKSASRFRLKFSKKFFIKYFFFRFAIHHRMWIIDDYGLPGWLSPAVPQVPHSGLPGGLRQDRVGRERNTASGSSSNSWGSWRKEPSCPAL